MQKKGLRILEVEQRSIAEKIGLAPGDRILTVNGQEVPDELALQFRLSEEFADFLILKANGTEEHLEADLSESTSLGVRIEEFRTRICSNACIFCFVDQLPAAVRPSLRVKDDDYRLSFLHGNYITLTNMREKEMDRIIDHRLSPMYVSVHSTDPDLRARMLGRNTADDLDGKLRKLIRGGIRIHAQIVLMPGINDSLHLQKTVFDLYEFYPGIQSVAVVPLGLSDHGGIKDRYLPVTPAFSKALICQAEPWQKKFRKKRGKTFVYLADEFYLQAGADLPETDCYDDFAQIEDGIGMVRNFLDEFKTALGRRRKSLAGIKGTLATGTLFFPTLSDCIQQLNAKFGASLQACKVENRFLGKGITVAGLLAGGDFLATLHSRRLGDFLVIPQEAVSRIDGVFLDDLSPADLSQKLGIPVYSSGRTAQDFFHLLHTLGSRQSGGRY
jgi:putative radical SAM enzyme (TIGR03279 family)